MKVNLLTKMVSTSLAIMLVMINLTGVANAAMVNGADAIATIDNSELPFSGVFLAGGVANPSDVSIDEVNHRLFVADFSNDRVVVYNLDSNNNLVDYTADYVFGQTSTSSVVYNSVTQSGMNGPRAVEFDATNNRLFVSDYYNQRILIFDLSSGITNNMNASYVLGKDTYTNASILAISAKTLKNPSDLVFDTANNRIFVTDDGNDRVLIWDVSNATLAANVATNGNHNADYVLGQNSFLTNAANSSYDCRGSDRMCGPRGLAYNSADEMLYIVEYTGHKVKNWTVSPATLAANSATSGNHNALAAIGTPSMNFNYVGTAINRFTSPVGATYNNNVLYVSDSGNHRVMVFDVTVFTTGESAINVLGQSSFTSSVIATTQSGMSAPYYLEYDTTNDLLIVPDYLLNRVSFYDASTASAASANNVIGQTTLSDEIIFTQSTDWNDAGTGERMDKGLNDPYAVTMDTVDHHLFVSDAYGYRILVYNLDTSNNLIDVYPDYVLGKNQMTTLEPFCSDIAVVGDWCMDSVFDIEYDNVNKRLFASDGINGRVLIFDMSSGITSGMSASNVLGAPDLFSFGSVTPAANTIRYPNGLSYDEVNDRLFVSDDTWNRVMLFNLSGGITDEMAASVILGQPDTTTTTNATTQSKLYAPQGLVYDDSSQKLYVADMRNSRVMVWNAGTGVVTGALASNVLGQNVFTYGVSSISQYRMNYPTGVNLDKSNNVLFVADSSNNRVLEYDISTITNGELAIGVLGQENYNSNLNSPVTSLSMDEPQDVFFDDGNNTLYVADTWNNRVLIYDYDNLQRETLISNGANAVNLLGQTVECSGSSVLDYTQSEVNNTQLCIGGLVGLGTWVTDVALDESGHRLFVADYNNKRVVVYNLDSSNLPIDLVGDYVLGQVDLESNITPPLSSTSVLNPTALSYDSVNNRLFVADGNNSRVSVFDVTTIVNNESAIAVLGQTDFVTSGIGLTQSNFDSVYGLDYDEDNGWLFASDAYLNRVLIFDVNSITNGEDAIYVIGQNDFVSDDYVTTQDGLAYPVGITLDTNNDRLFVVDQDNHRVMVWDVSPATMASNSGTFGNHNAMNVLGQTDFVTATNGLTASKMDYPSGVDYDEDFGRLFVADGWAANDRVLVFEVTTIVDGKDAVNVVGQVDFVTSSNTSSASSFDDVFGVKYDRVSDNLFVTDQNNSRVMIFDAEQPFGTPTGSGGGPVVVPEFSTYMYVLVLLFGASLIVKSKVAQQKESL